MGVGFLAVALAIFFSPGGKGWWWAMLFPGFSLIGKGVADIVTARTAMNFPRSTPQTVMPPARNTGEFATRNSLQPIASAKRHRRHYATSRPGERSLQ